MKIILKILTIIALSVTFFFTSCRTEDTELIQAPEGEVLKSNTVLSNFIQRIAMNDGSKDNIIDNSNCFSVQLPITVFVNGKEIIVNSESDFETIEAVFDEFDNDQDNLLIKFPITIKLANYKTIIINNISEFNTLSIGCNGENESDDDIECLDFQYPITVSVFNPQTEKLKTIIINNDNNFFDIIKNMNENDIVNIMFPITLILYDGQKLTLKNLNELETTIREYKDDCDEDDDFNYNDDDCNNCTYSQLRDILTNCSVWTINKLERNDTNLVNNYIGYTFKFLADGSVNINFGNTNFTGIWTASGSGNSISVSINIGGMSELNALWILHEIEQQTGKKVIDLKFNDDELQFKSLCN